MAVVALEGVSKSYRGVSALDGIDLNIEKGEIYVLLGSNGSGKSTLLRIVATLLKPDRGKVSVFGLEDRTKILRRMGTVFEHSAHWDHFTGLENAWFFARSYGISEGDARPKLEGMFNWIGLKDRCNSCVSTYSYGMKRKLSLIEALIHEPDLLILDEPSLGLDFFSRASLYSLLKDRASRGTTAILATNDVSEAAFLATKVALLRDGKILVSGDPTSLVSSLNALTKIELKIAAPLPLDSLMNIEGIKLAEMVATENKLRIMASGQHVLAPIVEEVVAQGGIIQNIEILEPNLGDVFTRFSDTGVSDAS